jgi:SMI1-KNR4 cell-wall
MKLFLKNAITNSSNVINKLEADLNLILPYEYREFLLLNNGGTIDTCYSFERKLNNDSQGMVIESILSVNDIYISHDNLKDWDLYKGMLVIIECLGSPVVCIGINEQNFGKIYVLDGDFGATFQSDSFNDFVNQLSEMN